MRAVVSKQADGHTNKSCPILIDEAPCNFCVGINSPVPQKRPVDPLGLDARKIGFRDEDVFFITGAFRDDLSRRIADKTLAQNSIPGPPSGASWPTRLGTAT